MSNVKEKLQQTPIRMKDVLDLVCFRNKTNILALRQYLGDTAFIAILDKFAGTYVRFPKAEWIYQSMEDSVLAMLYDNMKVQKKSGGVKAWNDAEFRFNKQCEKMKITFETGQRRAHSVLKEMRQVREWYKAMDVCDKNFVKDIF